MPPDDLRKSRRMGFRLTEAQFAHLKALMGATGKSQSALVNRALNLLTTDQMPDWLPPGEDVPIPLTEEVWDQLVLDAIQLITEAAAFEHALITARTQPQPVNCLPLYRVVKRASDILTHLARTLATLSNGRGESQTH